MTPALDGPHRVASQLLLAILLACVAAATAAPAPKPAGAKTHTLYMGADISIQWQEKLYRVQDVDDRSFVIIVDGQRTLIPTRRNAIYIKIEESLKVTPRFVTIANLKGERAYTPENDPGRRFMQMASMAGGAAALADQATSNMIAASQNLAGAEAAAAANPMLDLSAVVADAQQNANAASNAFNNSMLSMGMDMNSAGYHAGRMQRELAAEQYDALEITFDISTTQPLVKPYLIVVTRYREDSLRPHTARNWVYAETLPDIGEKPRRVRFLRGGFPPGFFVEHFHVHLYDEGVEIASSVARKRVALTKDEAFQFAVIDYIGRHRDLTLRPMLVKAFLPADIQSRLPAEKINETLYVKVNKDGRPTGAFLDEACARRVSDAELEAAVLDLRFNPALVKGKPVEGVAPVNLGEMTL